MAKSKKKWLSWHQSYILTSMLWLVLFVWYAPNMGVLLVGTENQINLQNLYTIFYCVSLVIASLIYNSGNYRNMVVISTAGTVIGSGLFLVPGMIMNTMAVIITAIFSGIFSTGILYIFVYILRNKEKMNTAIFMQLLFAVFSIFSALGFSMIPKIAFSIFSLGLIILAQVCAMAFHKDSPVVLEIVSKSKVIPKYAVFGMFAITALIMFNNTLNMQILDYNSGGLGNTNLHYYLGQLAAALLAFTLLIILSKEIWSLFFFYLFSTGLGLLFSLVYSNNLPGVFILSAFFFGFAEIGTVFQWYIAGILCKKYPNIWLLRGFITIFVVSTGMAIGVSTLLIRYSGELFYVTSAASGMSTVLLCFLMIPIIYRVQKSTEEELFIQEDKQTTGKMQKDKIPLPNLMLREQRINALTPREKEIIEHYLNGYSAPQIAHILNISENTVKVHSRTSYEKLEINTRAELFIKYGDKSLLQ